MLERQRFADANPGGKTLAETHGSDLYFDASPNQALASSALMPQGGSQPHENFMPYLCVNFIISLFGIFPQPS